MQEAVVGGWLDGRLGAGWRGVGCGPLVQRAVLVELWKKKGHAALGFPAYALPAPASLSLHFYMALSIIGEFHQDRLLSCYHVGDDIFLTIIIFLSLF